MDIDGWRVSLLGGLGVHRGNQTLTRFEMRRAGSLLARLAFYRQRAHPREELIEMLWPEEDPESARSRFRQVLTSLRHSLDSLGADSAELLLADRNEVRLNPERVSTDVSEFEACLRTASRATTASERAGSLKAALDLYTGELLPGYYEDWVLKERQQLQLAATNTLTVLATACAEMGDREQAVEYSSRAIASDPLREDLHRDLIQHYRAMGQTSRALRQYREMERVLWKELRAIPSPELQALGETLAVPVGGVVGGRWSVVGGGEVVSGEKESSDSGAKSEDGEPQNASLPVPLTRFFGREAEIERLVQMLLPSTTIPQHPTPNTDLTDHRPPTTAPTPTTAPPRLLSLVGLGGSGKTRLALEVARRCEDGFPGAVWFVPLVGVTDPQRIVEAITAVVCPFVPQERDQFRAIGAVLGRRPALLVLDNCEQIAEAGGPVVRLLLERLPDLHCIVTSRCRLNIAGEHEYSVSPLTVPETADETVDLEQCLSFTSVRLFVDRARMVQPDFALTAKNATSVLALSRRLEGIPLAIELAATWIGVLSPAQLVERLSGRLRLLSSSHNDTEERHQSLWATLEWSFQQLPPDLQQFFCQLSVFQGGWTLEAAEAVAVVGGPEFGEGTGTGSPVSLGPPTTDHRPPTPTLDYLARLRRHSLIQASETEGARRFRMLETLREFGKEQLTLEESRLLRQRHADYFRDLGKQAHQELTGPDQIEWLDRLEQEHDNVRAVLAWCNGPEGDVEAGLRLASSVWRFWDTRGHFVEAHRWLSQLLEKSQGISPAVRAEALAAKGNLGGLRQEFAPSIALFEESLALYRAVGDRLNAAWALCSLAVSLRDSRSATPTRPLFEECLAVFEEYNDQHGKARVLAALGVLAQMERDYSTAFSLLEKSAALYRVCGDKKRVAWCVHTRGSMAEHQGDKERAYAAYRNSLPLYRALGDVMWVVYTLVGLAQIAQETGQTALCYEYCLDGLKTARTASVTTWETRLLLWLGDLERAHGETDAALGRYREALSLSDRVDLTGGLYTAFRRLAALAHALGQQDRALCFLGCSEALGEATELEIPRPPVSDFSPDFTQPPVVSESETQTRAFRRGETMLRSEAVSFALADM